MKQLLFLLLFPCFALAQYQGNANQKITLGEQTTADGLVWRGRLADTANLLTNKLDTSVYIVLDTGTQAMWYYRASTTPKWTRLVDSLNNLQGQLSLTTKVTGTLPVANGGTGATSISPNNYLIRTNSDGTFDTSAIYETGGNVRIGTTANSTIGGFTNTSLYIKQIANGTGGGGLHIEQSDNTNVAFFGFSNDAFRIGTSYRTTGSFKPIEFFGSVGIGTNNPAGALEVYKNSGGSSIIDVARFGGNIGYATFNNYGDLLGTYDGIISSLSAAYTTNTAAFGTKSNSDLAIITNNARRVTVLKTGEFGIGTATPVANLQINSGTTTPTMAFSQSFSNTSAQRGGFAFYNNDISTVANITAQAQGDNVATSLQFYVRPLGGSLTQSMELRESGKLGIGTPSPTEVLHVVGNARISGLAGASNGRAVLADINGVLSAPVSSITTKENVQTLNYGLNEILKINPVSFDYINKDKWGDERNLGFIVEDMYPIVPEVTGTMDNGDMYLDMTKLIPILTKAIQEQNLLIKALEQRILNLENK